MVTAPLEWAYALFPLEGEGCESLSLEWVVGVACGLISEAESADDRAQCGQVFHWAHVLKSIQESAGDWPATVNARTGEVMGSQRTLAPVELMRKLDDMNQSTEYEAAIAYAEGRDPYAV